MNKIFLSWNGKKANSIFALNIKKIKLEQERTEFRHLDGNVQLFSYYLILKLEVCSDIAVYFLKN